MPLCLFSGARLCGSGLVVLLQTVLSCSKSLPQFSQNIICENACTVGVILCEYLAATNAWALKGHPQRGFQCSRMR